MHLLVLLSAAMTAAKRQTFRWPRAVWPCPVRSLVEIESRICQGESVEIVVSFDLIQLPLSHGLQLETCAIRLRVRCKLWVGPSKEAVSPGEFFFCWTHMHHLSTRLVWSTLFLHPAHQSSPAQNIEVILQDVRPMPSTDLAPFAWSGGSMAKEMAAAIKSFQEGDKVSALRTLQAAADKAPTRLPMLVMMACVQASQGRLQDALTTIAEVCSVLLLTDSHIHCFSGCQCGAIMHPPIGTCAKPPFPPPSPPPSYDDLRPGQPRLAAGRLHHHCCGFLWPTFGRHLHVWCACLVIGVLVLPPILQFCMTIGFRLGPHI